MTALRHRIRALAVGVAAFALVAVAAGGTFAASNPATLYACYDSYGNVRMTDYAKCMLPSGGRLVSWSTVGIPGPTGPTGPTGPAGTSGVRAWAKVLDDGAIYRSSGNVAVQPDYVGLPGLYCVVVTGFTEEDVLGAAAVVTPGGAFYWVAVGVQSTCTFPGAPGEGFVVGLYDNLSGNPYPGSFTIVVF